MAGTLTLASWPGTSGDQSLAYFDRGNEQNQFGRPSVAGVLPSRAADLFGSYTNEFMVTAPGGMQVNVAQGRAVAGVMFAKLQDSAVAGGVYALDVTAAHATLQRVDRVVVEFNMATGVVQLKMSNGTAATTGTAVPPALTQNAAIWQVPLAIVVVDPAVSTIAAVDVFDTRPITYTLDSLMRALAIQNPIINGGFQVWNDGTTLSSIANDTFGPEMFVYRKAGAVVHSLIRSSDNPSVAEAVPLEVWSCHLDVTTADASIASGDFSCIEHRIEGHRFKPLALRAFTIPFWVKDTVIGPHAVAFQNSGRDRSFVFQFFIEAADTWQLVMAHVLASPSAGTWDYSDGTGLRINWPQACGSTFQTTPGAWQTGEYLGTSRTVNGNSSTANNFKLAMVGRMSLGGIAIPFAPQNDEEALCRRYAQNIQSSGATYVFGSGSNPSTTQSDSVQAFQPMRAAPSVTYGSAASDFQIFANGAAVACTAIAASLGSGVDRIGTRATVASGLTQGHGAILAAVNGNAVIKLRSRLS